MPISPISKVKTIAYQLDLTEDIKTIYQTNLVVGTDYQPGYKVISFNAFIKNLKAFSSIVSLPTAAFPNFLPTDTTTQKTQKVLDIEWQSPRKQLSMYIAANSDVVPQWHKVGSVSLLNTYGYPFRIYNLMDLFTDNLALELGENSRIGVQIEDVGFGLLTFQDKVTIHGSYTEEMFLYSEDKQPVNNYSFEIRNISTGNSTGNGGGSIPTPVNNSISNSSLVSNNSSVGN